MPTTANVTFSNQYLTPVMDSEDARLIDVNIVASQTLARGTVLGETLGANGLAYLNITGAPTGGTFTLTYGAQTTAAIAYNALPEAIYTALAALSTIGAGNVAVTGTGPNQPNSYPGRVGRRIGKHCDHRNHRNFSRFNRWHFSDCSSNHRPQRVCWNTRHIQALQPCKHRWKSGSQRLLDVRHNH